ncbi:MAG: hypothetical protein EXR45_04900 [Chloroflexi bacterium]|nr:hypothetical protein [Chloroflexota bacterium]
MPRFLVAIHRPVGFTPSSVDERAMSRDIDALNDAMVDAGVRIFVGGLKPTSSAVTIIVEPNGHVTRREGASLNAHAYVDGFWVLETGTPEDAVEWGRKAAVACRASVEVRPFH